VVGAVGACRAESDDTVLSRAPVVLDLTILMTQTTPDRVADVDQFGL
jgi:hypothetical protein